MKSAGFRERRGRSLCHFQHLVQFNLTVTLQGHLTGNVVDSGSHVNEAFGPEGPQHRECASFLRGLAEFSSSQGTGAGSHLDTSGSRHRGLSPPPCPGPASPEGTDPECRPVFLLPLCQERSGKQAQAGLERLFLFIQLGRHRISTTPPHPPRCLTQMLQSPGWRERLMGADGGCGLWPHPCPFLPQPGDPEAPAYLIW